jgi:hypothetical protein
MGDGGMCQKSRSSARPVNLRLRAVDEAVAFWNRSLAEIGSRFRLGSLRHVAQPIPEEALHVEQVLSGGGRSVNIRPAGLAGRHHDCARSVGVRFVHHSPVRRKFEADRGTPRNDRLGAQQRTTLMCGRPASCRTDLFRSNQPRMFSLTENEKRRLLTLDPR